MGLRRFGLGVLFALMLMWQGPGWAWAAPPPRLAQVSRRVYSGYQPGTAHFHKSAPSSRHPGYPGQYPWYGTVWGVPTYNWGHFGAKPGGSHHCFETYYGDRLHWCQRRNYR